MFPSNLD